MNRAVVAVIIVGVLISAGCAVKSPTPSGFLPEQPELTESPTVSGAKVWKMPGVSPEDYDNVIVEPVRMFLDYSDEKYDDFDAAELKQLAVYARKALTDALSARYNVVEQAGPKTIIVRPAITNLEPSVPVMNAVTSVIPVGIVLSYGRKAVTGSHSWVGAMQYEIVFIDAATNEPVAMVMHHKNGEKWDIEGITDDLGHVRSQFDDVAEGMRNNVWYFAEPAATE